jgi:hypothetical protein
MKKTIAMLAIASLPLLSSAQVKFGVQGGFTFSRPEMSNTDLDLKVTHKLGPMFGAMVGVNLGESDFSLLQEFNYVFKGAKIEGTDWSTGSPIGFSGKQTTRYIEMPLNVLYYFSVGNGHFFFGGGPYAAVGLNGQNSITYQMANAPEVEEVDISFGSGPDQFKKWDFGAQALIGYKLGYGSYVKAYYSHGLSNLGNISDVSYYNRYFGLSFGYFFGSGR